MHKLTENSDVAVVDLLRRSGEMRISQLAQAMGVTATAVRQRLSRLMAADLVERTAAPAGRGRPSHHYSLTDKGRRQTGSNFVDLAVVLWQEVLSIDEPEIRRGLLERLSRRLATIYASQIQGETSADRMLALAELFEERDIPFQVETGDGELPVLKALGCPYTELAEKDRAICSMERMLFSEVLGHGLTLSECRLDGETCCTFQPN